MANPSVKIFISYAHEDVEFKNELINHLSALARLGIIANWHDSQILPGDKFNSEILIALENTNFIIFLISSDFLASDYIYNTEIKKAIERERKGEVRILPVIVRDCDFLSTPLSAYKILPTDATPIKSWIDRDEAWANVVNGIKTILQIDEVPKLNPGHGTSKLPVKEYNKRKGCSFQILISLCLAGIIVGVSYILIMNSPGSPDIRDMEKALKVDTNMTNKVIHQDSVIKYLDSVLSIRDDSIH